MLTLRRHRRNGEGRRLAVGAAMLAAALLCGGVAPGPVALAQTGARGEDRNLAALSATWWKWAAKLTVDPNGRACATGQSGDVWFLAGQNGTITERTCTIPAETAILFPTINGEWSRLEAQATLEATGNKDSCFVPGVTRGTDDRALRACAAAQMDHVTQTWARVDGTAVPISDRNRAVSDPFNFSAVAGNLFGIPPGPNRAVADGFWVLLPRLSPGRHTVEFGGTAVFREVAFTFTTTMKYDLRVARADH
jgi:hypothetical protein